MGARNVCIIHTEQSTSCVLALSTDKWGDPSQLLLQ